MPTPIARPISLKLSFRIQPSTTKAPMIARMEKAQAMAAEQRRLYKARLKAAK